LYDKPRTNNTKQAIKNHITEVFEQTKELNRRHKSYKDRQRNGQTFEHTKEKTEAVNLTRIENTMANML
jgi:hypothetical protein